MKNCPLSASIVELFAMAGMDVHRVVGRRGLPMQVLSVRALAKGKFPLSLGHGWYVQASDEGSRGSQRKELSQPENPVRLQGRSRRKVLGRRVQGRTCPQPVAEERHRNLSRYEVMSRIWNLCQSRYFPVTMWKTR